MSIDSIYFTLPFILVLSLTNHVFFFHRIVTSESGLEILFPIYIRCLAQIGSALIIDDSAFTKDSINPKTNKGKARPPLFFTRFHDRMSNEATLIHACVYGVFYKWASQFVVWIEEKVDGALENFRSKKRERMADMKRALVQGSVAATLNNDRGDFRRFLCNLRYLGLTEISNAQGLDHLPSAHTWENYLIRVEHGEVFETFRHVGPLTVDVDFLKDKLREDLLGHFDQLK
ncbi:hypothetical protein DVH24_026694 [Malus domestica]|uniref:Uncharacterized protein n=1 Tax=Malus domestica TaxID=3750 RepID=A0A498K790_MALDO|nr:hypothetical protein DVH24_026694 [Malus domestica]